MKIIKCNAHSFENSDLDIVLRLDDTFLVPEKFEKNPAFIEGMRVGNLEVITIDNVGELRKVIGMTEDYIQEFVDTLSVVDQALADSADIPEPTVPEDPAPPEDGEGAVNDSAPVPPPDLDKKTYRELQTYAKIVSEKFDTPIDRGEKFPDLKASILKVLEENK